MNSTSSTNPNLLWRINHWLRGGNLGVARRYSKKLKRERLLADSSRDRCRIRSEDNRYQKYLSGVAIGVIILVIRAALTTYFPQWFK